MHLTESRRAIRGLLRTQEPADASAVYYAYHHPDRKVQIATIPETAAISLGYVCSARTGIDLFRPLVTMRLPQKRSQAEVDYSLAADLLHNSLPTGVPVIISTRFIYRPLIEALFEIEREEKLRILILDRQRFEPVINVLVTRNPSSSGLPGYIIRTTNSREEAHFGEILASAGLNWRSPNFADLYVHTKDNFRRLGLGRSVAAALIQEVLDSGRTPLYAVSETNEASINLASSIGFVDNGIEELLIEGSLRELPINSGIL